MSNLDEEDYNDISNINWDEEDFDVKEIEEAEARNLIQKSNQVEDESLPTQDHLESLNRFFGHKNFRPMQWKIISSIINDKRDNCAIMATGYGKSLCYQFPSVYCGGLTIVISPLISLMQDQVLSLEMANIPACLLGSAQTKQKAVIDDIFNNKYSLLYVTPEFCCGDFGEGLLKKIDSEMSITLIAIDEAHCVSTWGHDFRFQYRELGKLRKLFPHIPILAVTATATIRVRNDIINSLGLRNPQVLCSGFDRPNLYFSVYLKGSSGAFEDLQKYMVRENGRWFFTGSTIIYCITRKQTEEMADMLNSKGIKCAAYHGSLSNKIRAETHELFVKDKIKVIVATIAFGMGIDKPDVRRIIHYGSSKNLESYYQEVGRAGRDGQPAECVTFYSQADFEVLRNLRETGFGSDKQKQQNEAMTKQIRQYFDSRDCRRQFILNHFEGNSKVKKEAVAKCCDNCTRKLTEKADNVKYEGLDEEGRYDFSEDTRMFLTAVKAMNSRFGLSSYILLLRGSKNARISRYQSNPLFGIGKTKSEDWWKALANMLEREKYLQKVNGIDKFMKLLEITPKGEMFLRDAEHRPHLAKFIITPPQEMFKHLKLKRTEPKQVEVETNNRRMNEFSASKKANLKRLALLKPSTSPTTTTTTQSVIKDIEVEEPAYDIETEEEKKERETFYRMLLNKRIDVAHKMDCMPYMVATNADLMKMAKTKPTTMAELKQANLEYNDAKMSKFGPEWVRTIRILCNLNPDIPVEEKKPISDILKEHPLPTFKQIGMGAQSTYDLFKEGLTVSEVAKKRGCAPSTVTSHLIDCIKVGYPIKLIDLNISDEERNLIIGVIKGPKIRSNTSLISPIKMECPESTSLETIKAVVAYVQVREHLKRLHIPFEDFEEPYDDIINISMLSTKAPVRVSVVETTAPVRVTFVETRAPETSDDALDMFVRYGEEELNSSDFVNAENSILYTMPSSRQPSCSQQVKKRPFLSNEDMYLLEDPPIISAKRKKPQLEIVSSNKSTQKPPMNFKQEMKEEKPPIKIKQEIKEEKPPMNIKQEIKEENSSPVESKNDLHLLEKPVIIKKEILNENKDINTNIVKTNNTISVKKEFKFKKVDKKLDLPSWLDEIL